MTQEQIGGTVRTVISFLLGLFAAKLNIDGATVASIAAGASTLIVAAWSIWAKSPANTVASAQALPGVQVVATPALAKAAGGDVASTADVKIVAK